MAQTFYFQDDFQDLILANLVRNPSRFAALYHLVKPDYFWGNHAAKTCQLLLDYHAEYSNFPTFTSMRNYVIEHYGESAKDLAAEALKYLQKLSTINCRDWRYVKDRLVFFCRERALVNAINLSSDAVRTSKWPEGGFAPIFEKALRIGQDTSELGLDLVTDADAVIDKITASTFGVKTGYSMLDSIWPVGWGKGWLVGVLAPPKSYKTTFCINLALNMTSNQLGKRAVNVHYYACEIEAELALARAYCRVGRQSMETLYKQTEVFRKQMHDGLNRHWVNGGRLFCKSFPSKAASIQDIRAHAITACETLEWTPSVIFIDHAETVRAPKTGRDMSDWRAQAEIYTQARAMAKELNCVVVMPDRANKEMVGKDVPNMTNFQGSFEKAGILDVAIGLCQTEVERQKNVLRYFIFINRHGPQFGYYRGKVNPDTMTLGIDHTLDFEKERLAYEQAERDRKQGRRGGRKAPVGNALEESD